MSIKEKLESLGRNSIQLKIVGKETHKLGATRFGGKPDVPPDFVWPTYEGESYDHVVKDRPLTFLAQFNCAELAQFDKEHLLPDHGLLSFFYETDTQCWGYDPNDKGCASSVAVAIRLTLPSLTDARTTTPSPSSTISSWNSNIQRSRAVSSAR